MSDSLETLIVPALEKVAPAITLCVYHQGAVVRHAAWGWIDPETRQLPVTADTLFDLASVTKLFTTTAFLRLAAQQGISLKTPLVEIIPEFGQVSPRGMDGGQDPHSKKLMPTPDAIAGKTVDPQAVTLWHLLTHTSGLAPWRDVYTVAPAPLPKGDPIPQAERWQRGLARMVGYPFVEPIGAAVRYSDIGLMLLGEVVARLNGTPLDKAIRQQVLDPLGVTDIAYNPMRDYGVPAEKIAPTEIDPDWRKRRVWGEVHDENACGLGGVAGHAGLFGTAQSVAKLGEAWRTRSIFDLTPELWQQATSEQARTGAEIRGLGWMLRSPENSSAGDRFSMASFGHTGFTGTSLWIDPERHLTVALLTNRVYMGRENPGIHALRRAVHDQLAEDYT